MIRAIKSLNVVTGEVTEMLAGLPLKVGDLVRPIGHATAFRVEEVTSQSDIESVIGHTIDGRYKVSGRVADMVRIDGV